MGRWPKFEARRRDALVKEVRAQLPPNIGGTIRSEDILIGKSEMVADAIEHGLSQSQAYASVNTLGAQPFVLSVGSQRFSATLVDTSAHWHSVGRADLARTVRASLPHVDYGRMGGRGNKKA